MPIERCIIDEFSSMGGSSVNLAGKGMTIVQFTRRERWKQRRTWWAYEKLHFTKYCHSVPSVAGSVGIVELLVSMDGSDRQDRLRVDPTCSYTLLCIWMYVWAGFDRIIIIALQSSRINSLRAEGEGVRDK